MVNCLWAFASRVSSGKIRLTGGLSLGGFLVHMSSFWAVMTQRLSLWVSRVAYLHVELLWLEASCGLTAGSHRECVRREKLQSRHSERQKSQRVFELSSEVISVASAMFCGLQASPKANPDAKGEGNDSTSWWWRVRVTVQKNMWVEETPGVIFGKYNSP